MRDGALFRDLGFVRLGDYVVERLGISYRTAQELMRAGEKLERLPLVAAAYDAGEISAGHVRLLTRAAEPSNEAFHLALARRSTVRELARALAEREDAATASAGDPQPDEAVELERFELGSPAWIATLWRDTVSHMRWVVGRLLPRGTCFDMALAEYRSSRPLTDPFAEPREPNCDPVAAEKRPVVSQEPPARAREPHSENEVPALSDRTATSPASQLHGSALSLVHEAISCGAAASAEAEGAATKRDTRDARTLDHELRLLAAERQGQEAALADHLHAMRVGRAYSAEGSPSLEAYARDRLGLSPRRLYYLLALRRTLAGLPLLRGEFLTGRLTLRQVLLIGRVAVPETERAWMQRAVAVTFRRLEDEVSYWLHLKETRPAVWACLQGEPLPERLVLTPGQPPRLHASAHRRRRSRREVPDRAHARPALATAGGPAEQAYRAVSCEFVTAEMFLCALQEDEDAEPLPPRMCRIRMRLEPEVRKVWEETVAECREHAQRDLDEWEVFALVLHDYWKTWDTQEMRRQRREHSTLERDGWRCTVPGCRSIGSGQLHEHHIVFRSLGGPVRQPRNVTTLCSGHHLGLLHLEKMRCTGRAPDDLEWELGLERGREPFLIFKGERRIGGVA
jgi:hypothetical protein